LGVVGIAHASGGCHTPGFNYTSAIFLWHVCQGATLGATNGTGKKQQPSVSGNSNVVLGQIMSMCGDQVTARLAA